jgi:MauM/NapG family ferredoxin protein
MAAFGVHWIGIFDPLSLLYRSITAAVLPAVQYIVDDASTAVYQADPTIGSFEVTSATEPVYEFFRDEIFVAERQTFTNALVIGLVFVGIVALNLVRPRFWCRYACPLGAGLGLLSKRTSLRLENRTDICNQCGRCNLACPAAAQPDVPGEWLPTECYVCWNCVAACSFSGLKFHFEPPWKRPAAGKLDLGKRAVVGAGLAGVLGIFLLRLTPTAQARRLPPELVRPPGALAEREFLQRCIQCGACMRVCPTNALHPAGFVGGAEAAWTPRLIAKIGACEYNCNLCTQVCPTEAIQPLPLEEKQERKIGLASFDTGRCLPYAYGRNCAVCEEHCPVPDKAIYFVDVDVETRDGGMETLLQPRVDPDKCIGCGMCEWSCVFQDKAAIRVTRANESRNPDNQPILPDFGGDSPYGF